MADLKPSQSNRPRTPVTSFAARKQAYATLGRALVVLWIMLPWLGNATAQQEPSSLQSRKADLEVQKLELEVAKLKEDSGELTTWLTGVSGLLLGVLGTAASVWMARRAQFGTLDQSVHDKRLELYPKLVNATARLAVYFPSSDQPISPKECGVMGQAMSDWYFEGGGLLMSVKTRDAYFRLARALTRASLAKELRVPMFPKDAEDISVQKVNEYRNELAHLDDVESWSFGDPVLKEEKPVHRFKDFVFLQRLSSAVRTMLSEDLRSRRRPTKSPL